jgi:predicted phage terminase large subunit-like protein
MTRWHEDDLAGRLLQREPELWQVLKLPALANEDDPLGRQAGEALWPCDQHGDVKPDFDEEGLALTKRRGPQAFRALYQQDPVGLEGLGIQRSWWRRYDEPPEKIAELCDTMLMSWDTTFKDTDSSDYVGGLVLGRLGQKVFLLDGIREHLNAPNTMREIRKMRSKWPQAKRVLIEESANGPAIIQMLEQEFTGIVPVRAQGSKTVRLHWGVSSVAGFIEDGNVYLPRAHSKHSEAGRCHVEIAEELISEGAAFPHGAHDDLVDACVQGVSFLIPQGWANLRKWGKEIAEEVEANVGFVQQHNIALRQAIRKKVELQLKNKEVGSDMPGWN